MNLKSVFVIICLIQSAFCFQARAGDVTRKAKELTGLQSKIRKLSDSIDDLKVKKNILLVELRALDSQYGKATVQLKQVERLVDELSVKINKNKQSIVVKRAGINSQKQALQKLVKSAHGLGQNERLKLLLNQQDSLVLARMMVYYDYFNNAKLDKINKINADMVVLQDLESKQAEEAAQLDRELLKRASSSQLLLKKRAQRKILVAKIDKRFASKKQQLSRSKQSEKKLKKLISSLQQIMDDFPIEEGAVRPFAKLKGKLPWPVKGKLVKKFGEQRSDSQWDGVLIKAKEGRDIRAITRGRVVYADWLRGYGLLTIIDHGKGYMTLYAFTQSLYRTVGEWVDAGSVIATVGVSGGQSEAGLYFGIRKKGKPVNPVKWCRKVRHGNI